jgi:hypothetical protein
MLIARAADRRPIAFERRLQDFQARGGREFHELGARIDEEIDERKMALAEGIDLIRRCMAASCWVGVRPRWSRVV